jgi:hypothetical protein
MSIQFNNSDKIYGGFQDATPAKITPQMDSDLAAGIGLGLLGIGLAAGVAAALDDDDYSYRRRQAEAEAAERRARERERIAREAERHAEEIRRDAERAARRAAYGLSTDEVTHEIVKFCMKHDLTNKMVVMTAIIRELSAQGARFTSAEGEFGDLKIKGHCVDGNDLKITLSSIGGITVYAYDGKLIRYSSSSEVFKEYELLVKDYNKPNFDKLARVMSY